MLISLIFLNFNTFAINFKNFVTFALSEMVKYLFDLLFYTNLFSVLNKSPMKVGNTHSVRSRISATTASV